MLRTVERALIGRQKLAAVQPSLPGIGKRRFLNRKVATTSRFRFGKCSPTDSVVFDERSEVVAPELVKAHQIRRRVGKQKRGAIAAKKSAVVPSPTNGSMGLRPAGIRDNRVGRRRCLPPPHLGNGREGEKGG